MGIRGSVVDWRDDGYEIRNFVDRQGRLRSRPQNLEYMFRSAVAWAAVTSGSPAFRWYPDGFLFDNAGMSLFLGSGHDQLRVLGFLNSSVARELLKLLSPTMNLNAGQISGFPVGELLKSVDVDSVGRLLKIFRADWASRETSWEFSMLALCANRHGTSLESQVAEQLENWRHNAQEAFELEQRVDRRIATSAVAMFDSEARLSDISLTTNLAFSHKGVREASVREVAVSEVCSDLVSYAAGRFQDR